MMTSLSHFRTEYLKSRNVQLVYDAYHDEYLLHHNGSTVHITTLDEAPAKCRAMGLDGLARIIEAIL